MSKAYSLCLVLDVAGFLLHATRKDLTNLLRHTTGEPMSPGEAKQWLLEELAQGHRILPLCQHNNFDYEAGVCRQDREEVPGA